MATTFEVRLSFHPRSKVRVVALLAESGIHNFVESRAGWQETITFYSATAREAEAVVEYLNERLLPSKGGLEISLQELADEDWQTAWQKYWTPVEVSPKMCICPPWADYSPGPGQQVIRLQPGMAFGSGTHPTTKLCLRLLEAELAATSVESFLDFGCGTGVLSIAAKKLGAGHVVGVDIDNDAIRLSRQNAEANGVPEIDFSTKTLDELQGTFTLICANILSGIIRSHWPELKDKAAGKILLSGIVVEEADTFLKTLHCPVLERHELDGWVAALV